jgi:putative FmdB family regulatory protein
MGVFRCTPRKIPSSGETCEAQVNSPGWGRPLESPGMPIYEFVCMECESHYEELVAMGASADCPDCGSANVRKQISVFAAHGVESGPASFGGGGGCCGGSCGCGH